MDKSPIRSTAINIDCRVPDGWHRLCDGIAWDVHVDQCGAAIAPYLSPTPDLTESERDAIIDGLMHGQAARVLDCGTLRYMVDVDPEPLTIYEIMEYLDDRPHIDITLTSLPLVIVTSDHTARMMSPRELRHIIRPQH